MFLPIGDEPNLRGIPWVTYGLIGLNIAVYLFVAWPLSVQGIDLQDPWAVEYVRFMSQELGMSPRMLASNVSSYDVFIFKWGFKPGDPSLLSLFLSMFMHAGFLHPFGNMLFLWIYGDNVELQIGRVGYLLIYLLTGIAATTLHAVVRSDSLIPMVGASGAISGVLGCYFLWFPRNYVRVLVVFIFFFNVIKIPARLVLGFYLVIENLLPFLMTSSETGVAYGAHIGGFIGGLGCAALVTRWTERGSILKQAATGEADTPFESFHEHTLPSSKQFQQNISQGNYQAALRTYLALEPHERIGLYDDDILHLADWLTETGQMQAALSVIQRFIATHPRSRALPRAYLRAGMIHLHADKLPTAYQYFLSVLEFDSTEEEKDAARIGLKEIERRERSGKLFGN